MNKFIQNIGDYFSSNYFDEDFTAKVIAKTGYAAEDVKEFNKRISPLKDRYFRYKQLIIEGKLRVKDQVFESHQFHTEVLNSLGYDGSHPEYNHLFHLTEHEVIPVRHILYRGDQPHLMVMEMQSLIKEDDIDPDGLFEQRYNVDDESQTNPPQRYHRSQWERVFTVPVDVKISPVIINKAISTLFLLEQHLRPKYILLLAGNVVFLLEQEKWFRGSYLQIDLEELFSEATANRNANYYALFYFLLGKETLTPDSNMVLLDQLDEDSHKSAYEVTKDLKEGIIHAVEALANEALFYQKNILNEVFDETDDTFESEIKDDCLTFIYRMLFIFYAESREDLDILPSNDPVYNKGYSLEMLRDLEQVPLYSDNSLNGYFFHESLSKLFELLSSGYREQEITTYDKEKIYADKNIKINKSFKVRHIDSPLFNNQKLHHLHKVKFRNKVWQDIICRLSLSKQQRNRARGRISYANLGINQLGSVYESLLAYRGFYAEQDYIEVHKANDPKEGTYLVPRMRRDDFQENEILKDENRHDAIIKKGTFVYRLSGRDRQKSASYYTPEVLTRCTVKYTLKPILEKLDKSEMKASELLELKLLEPAMGAAAFHNEMINQLAEAYLNYRQKELRDAGRIEWRVQPDKFKEELQKVKAYIATNNTYGVDLNPTAIELGKLSLWLNVIHKDMETPFFSNRLAVGNAVVGAWLKVYPAKEICVDTDAQKKTTKLQTKKEWWEKAPRQLDFKPTTDFDKIKHLRKQDEIYHFLLPDKNMVPSSGIKMLKTEYDTEAKAVTNWKKEWCKPISLTELEQLKRICNKVDELLAEYYRFQRSINQQTASKQEIFGVTVSQRVANLQTYDEKERLADQRNRQNAPYFKLKMVMDYWCSLWFWDVRQAGEIPDRQQYWQDIAAILELDTNKALEGIIERRGQQKLFEAGVQLSFAMEPAPEKKDLFADAVTESITRTGFFDNNQRIGLVSQLAQQYYFFHPQLEFLDVFWERGGFDLIAGNPPWLKITFEESGIISEKFPEIAIHEESATKVSSMHKDFFADQRLKEMYIEEMQGTECTAVFLNAMQNYPLLVGQQTNLYKCVLENGFSLLSKHGFMGLLHPEGVYDDPNGQILRKEIYQRLRYHFQFINELMLFSEIDHHNSFGTHIYSGKLEEIDFISINNLFHPSTIDGCFVHNGHDTTGGYKVKDKNQGKMIWNVNPHKDRIVQFTETELKVLAQTFEGNNKWQSTSLVSIHANPLIRVFKLFSYLNRKVGDIDNNIFEGFHETGAQSKNVIKKVTPSRFPILDNFELIHNGPHFYISNPLYKTPRKLCKINSDYEVIQLNEISDEYIPNTNYLPSENFKKHINDELLSHIKDFKLGFIQMMSITGERSLQSAIFPPYASQINKITSICFMDESILLELCGITSSIIYDFYIRSIGKSGFYSGSLRRLPFGIEDKFKYKLFDRTLLLNCVNKYYTPFWERNWQEAFILDQWTKPDARLKPFDTLTQNWQWSTPLRNWFERRQALVEIDVITAMALGLTLDELILIYNVQFPVLQQNEDDTWYDTRGNIVFTCSKGLTGVGLDRKEWEQIRELKAGQTYEHTITKSELYQGKKITYHAPFDKCDRVEDYKVAWTHFEEIFN